MAALIASEYFVAVSNNKSLVVTTTISNPDKTDVLNIPDLDAKPAADPSNSSREGNEKGKTDGSPPATNSILAMEASASGQYVAICDDRKYLHVYLTRQQPWRLLSSRCVSRRCTTVRFTQDETKILVADKSGDVFAFSVLLEADQQPKVKGHTPQQQRQELSTKGEGQEDAEVKRGGGQEAEGTTRKEENIEKDEKEDTNDDEDVDEKDNGVAEDETDVTQGELKLGHLSMLLDMVLVDDDHYVVTCDRDEKIRISDYPHTFNIQAYCLGHTAFVKSVVYDKSRKVIISGSGDCTLRVWNLQGQQLCCVDVLAHSERTALGEDDSQMTSEDGDKSTKLSKVDSSTEGSKVDSPTSLSRPAIQQMVYCDKCSLLVVAMHRSPELLFFKVCETENDQTSLEFVSSHQCVYNVAAVCVRESVLWVTSYHPTRLGIAALRLQDGSQTGSPSLIPIAEDEQTVEGRMLTSLSKDPTLLRDNSSIPDPIPHLWKSNVDGYVAEYKERKRQRLQGRQDNCRWGKHAKGERQAAR